MIWNKLDDDEKETLLSDKSSVYGSSNIEGNNYSKPRSRVVSLEDTSSVTSNYKRHSSYLEWASSSWIRWPYLLFYWWLNPLLKLGSEQNLTDDDLDDLPQHDKSLKLFKKMLIYDWSTSTTWRIVLCVFGKQTLYSGLVYLPLIAVRIAQPVFLHAIIRLIINEEKSNHRIMIGTLFATGLCLASLLSAIFYQFISFRCDQMGIRIRNALSGIIYGHSLSVNITSFYQTNSSRTINLIANDVAKFDYLWQTGHFLWAAPLEGIITFFIMCRLIGVLTTALAFSVLILLIPMQIIIGRYFNVFYQRTIIDSDKRIKAYTEILDGCQTIKVNNWEKPMEERMLNLRKAERESIRAANYLRAINISIFFLSPCLMSLAAFVGMWCLGYKLRPTEVFTALAFFLQIRLPIIYILPLNIERLSASLVASKRIDAFMRMEKKQTQKRKLPILYEKDENNKPGRIIMRDASFSWKDSNYCLTSLNIDIKPGQFIGIMGSVGSGKTSLLSTILGEMNLINGNIQITGSLSYAAQSTWIFADTIRANILLRNKFDPERYKSIICACCLDIDFKAFGESGDLTMIGEKGVNLSGGQKARVSLARALYTHADIYLLDDPFAAVDSKVAKKLFNNCIGPQSLLKEKGHPSNITLSSRRDPSFNLIHSLKNPERIYQN